MKNLEKLTIGIFAHANAGKTTITEQLLFYTNTIKSVGRVDTGTTVTDSLALERQRGITIQSSVVSFVLNGRKIQLIDTPGHIDFSAEVERAINALDGAVLVVSGVEGVEAQTFTIWKQLKEKNVPTIVYINKMDRMGANYNKVLNEMCVKLHANIVPVCMIETQSGTILSRRSMPEEMLEYLLDIDPDYVSTKLEEIDTLEYDEVVNHVYSLSRTSSLCCVIGGSALKGIGISELMTCLANCLPSHLMQFGDFAGYIFAVRVKDEKKRAFMKVLQGSLALKDVIRLSEENEVKVSSLYISNGCNLLPVNEVTSGDVAVLENLSVCSGQAIGYSDEFEKFANYVHPILDMQVEIEKDDEISVVMNALEILNEEDPYLNVRFSTETKKICVSLMGEVQAQVVKQMIKERFNLDIVFANPVLIHKEAPTVIGKASAYYTRVSGVELEVLPLPRGSGLRFESIFSTDFLHKKYQRQTERLVMQYVKQGIFGWEVTDADIRLTNGKFDSLGSEPKHFNIAVPLALMRALAMCKMEVLEPISQFTIVAPNTQLNLITQYVTGKGAAFEVSYDKKDTVTINGEVPMRQMLDAPMAIAKLTSGLGFFYSKIIKYSPSYQQEVENQYYGPDPRNEVRFVINDMKAGLDSLDPVMSKKKKVSRSKFKRVQKEREIKSLKSKGKF